MTLRNDATRASIVTTDKRRMRSVVGRQGQVLLDTDFDQNTAHQLYRIETETVDELGSPGRFVVPTGNNGFKISGAPGSFDIGPGHGYLGGWLLENPASCKLNNQPHRRLDSMTAPAIVGIKALVRHIDPAEEPVLADLALGDAQAAGRSLVDWQVFPLNLGGGSISCATVLANPTWQKLTGPSTGTLAARTVAAAPSADPCSLTPGGGYSRLENLLYRIEVHDGVADPAYPTVDGPRFGVAGLKLKLSRRNASVMARVTKVAADGIEVAPAALDPRNWFAPGQFAEIVSIHDDVDPAAALDPAKQPRLFRVANATDTRIILEGAFADVTKCGISADGTWFLRLWDAWPTGDGLYTVTLPSGMISPDIDLGDGLSVCLGTGTFRRGDFWNFAARVDGTIDWPVSGGLATQMRPHGPEVRYAPLAVLLPLSPAVFEDCRTPFATLTDKALLYRGGDGQNIAAPAGSGMVPLKATLRLAVMRGETPAVNVPVRFSFLEPSGSSCLINGVACNAGTSPEVLSDANGLVEVTWSIDGSRQLDVHKVQAAIATGPGTVIPPPVVFEAIFETALHTTYEPGKCKHLVGVDNVQDAIDTLCKHIDDKQAMGLTQILLYDNSKLATPLIDKEWILNGFDASNDAFVNGIIFGFDEAKLDIKPETFDPIVEVELDLPYPTTDPERLYWTRVAKHAVSGGTPGPKTATISGPFGFQRIRLDGSIKVGDGSTLDGKNKIGKSSLIWTPSAQAKMFLNTVSLHHWGQTLAPGWDNDDWKPDPPFEKICCRIRLRGAQIYARDEKTGDRLYLNAEYLGDRATTTRRELSSKDRDPQRAGDLDLFIYLAYVPPNIRKNRVRDFILSAITRLSG